MSPTDPPDAGTGGSAGPPRPALGRLHQRRLREVWRSAGWPCQDLIEVELLAAGLLERRRDPDGRESLRVSDAGIQVLAATLHRNRAAFDSHESLVARVVREMQRAGRVAWRGLRLRAPPQPGGDRPDPGLLLDLPPGVRPRGGPSGAWPTVMPDVFSIRHTTRDDLVEPVVHEVKVRRADLLADLRREAKRAAYLALASQCWYVLKAGIGDADDVPRECGVMLAHEQALEVLRPAPRRAMQLPLATWMALARANAEPPSDDDAQAWLGDPGEADPGASSEAPQQAGPTPPADPPGAPVTPP